MITHDAYFSNYLEVRPVVTVVIPTYCREGSLLRLLPQLLDQKLKQVYEILIIDQTPYVSTHVRDLLNGGGAPSRYLQLKEPSIPSAWNIGIALARGEIIIFLDDDCFVSSSFIESHLAAHAQAKNIVGVMGQILSSNEKTRSSRHWVSNIYEIGWCFFPWNYSKPARIAVAPGGNFSFKKKAAVLAGGVDQQYEKTSHCFEPEFCFRLKRFGEIVFSPVPKAIHIKELTGGIRKVVLSESDRVQNFSSGAFYFMFLRLPFWFWPIFLFSEFRFIFNKKEGWGWHEIFRKTKLIVLGAYKAFLKVLKGPIYFDFQDGSIREHNLKG